MCEIFTHTNIIYTYFNLRNQFNIIEFDVSVDKVECQVYKAVI